MMPLSSAFLVNNVGVSQQQLPLVFMVTGLSMLIILPIIGKMSDKIGKYKVFFAGSIMAMTMLFIYSNLNVNPLWIVIFVNVFLFAGIMSRAVPSSALMSAMPDIKDRGAFMGINSSIQQLAGGIASVFSGLIVIQLPNGKLENYNLVGYTGMLTMLICIVLMFFIHKAVLNKK